MDQKQLKNFNKLLAAGLVGIYTLTGALYAGLTTHLRHDQTAKKD